MRDTVGASRLDLTLLGLALARCAGSDFARVFLGLALACCAVLPAFAEVLLGLAADPIRQKWDHPSSHRVASAPDLFSVDYLNQFKNTNIQSARSPAAGFGPFGPKFGPILCIECVCNDWYGGFGGEGPRAGG